MRAAPHPGGRICHPSGSAADLCSAPLLIRHGLVLSRDMVAKQQFGTFRGSSCLGHCPSPSHEIERQPSLQECLASHPTPDPTRSNQKWQCPRRSTIFVLPRLSGWKFLPTYFWSTDSRNNFESWQKDVVSHFSFDVGKDHSGGAQNEIGSNRTSTSAGSESRIRNQLLLEGSRVACILEPFTLNRYAHSSALLHTRNPLI